MKTSLTRRMRIAAHYAAQRVAQGELFGHGRLSASERRQVLDRLVELGFPRCMLRGDDGSLRDTHGGYQGDDESNLAWAVYDVAEAKAAVEAGYLEEISDLGEWPHGDSGPGRPFTRPPTSGIRGSRFLVRQIGGLDI